MVQERCFYFAGGGTGGHIYPALAVAERLRELAPEVGIHFFCSERPIDRDILSKTGFDFTPLPAQGLSLSPAKLWRFIQSFRASTRQTRGILSNCTQPVIVGVGGFVAAPVAWVARRDGHRLALINVDIVAGKANRVIARWAQDIFLQFEDSVAEMEQHGAQCHVVGCPLRTSFNQADKQRAIEGIGLNPDKHTLLITGASSGAQNINQTLIALLEQLNRFADTWQVVHLTGSRNFEEVKAATEKATIDYHVRGYYDDMPDLLAAADLLIGRSGAVSVAEYAAAGVPSICMPYPYHKDRHQYRNAGKLVEVGAAVIVDDVPNNQDRCEWLWEELEPLLSHSNLRRDMAQACNQVARRDAADRIARQLLG